MEFAAIDDVLRVYEAIGNPTLCRWQAGLRGINRIAADSAEPPDMFGCANQVLDCDAENERESVSEPSAEPPR